MDWSTLAIQAAPTAVIVLLHWHSQTKQLTEMKTDIKWHKTTLEEIKTACHDCRNEVFSRLRDIEKGGD